MKRGKKMLTIILITTVALGLITWGVFAFLGRSQTLSVKSIENASADLYVVRLEKPDNMTWKPGSYVKITLPDVKDSKQNNRWLTIASNPEEKEIIILTHNRGSVYKKNFPLYFQAHFLKPFPSSDRLIHSLKKGDLT